MTSQMIFSEILGWMALSLLSVELHIAHILATGLLCTLYDMVLRKYEILGRDVLTESIDEKTSTNWVAPCKPARCDYQGLGLVTFKNVFEALFPRFWNKPSGILSQKGSRHAKFQQILSNVEKRYEIVTSGRIARSHSICSSRLSINPCHPFSLVEQGWEGSQVRPGIPTGEGGVLRRVPPLTFFLGGQKTYILWTSSSKCHLNRLEIMCKTYFWGVPL